MSLGKYAAKRKFEATPEPPALRRFRPDQGREEALRFVVQKHRASTLHYDFRLEVGGVLKSWAVPKGPSLNPHDKRLAIQVEDHPLAYFAFEGVIPRGNYGAGQVIVWDAGTYVPELRSDSKNIRRAVEKGLEKGHLAIRVNGKKLRGIFSLARVDKRSWLLVKHGDGFASEADVRSQERSVISDRTLDDLRDPSANAIQKKEPDFSYAPAGTMPQNVKPMLASLADAPFDREGWLFEIKWDGYRAIAEVSERGVRLYSRTNQAFTERFGAVASSLGTLGKEAVFDGEVVILDSSGRPRFELLQNYPLGGGSLVYYVFDILHYNGKNLTALPLARRKEILAAVLPDLENVKFSDHIETYGRALFDTIAGEDLEGIVAKNGQSPYRAGRRSDEWLKIPVRKRQEVVVAGFTEPRARGASRVGSFVVGVYQGKELIFAGRAGIRGSERIREDYRKKLEPFRKNIPPFIIAPPIRGEVQWLEPRFVGEVLFSEWTEEGRMRHPVFVGFREDKEPRLTRRETGQAPRIIEGEISAGERRVPFCNLSKVFWPEDGYTKGDLVAYYRAVAPFILPHLEDRPLTLLRYPNGIHGKHFFQKQAGHFEPWVSTITAPSDSDDREVHYALCQDEAMLLYLVNLGCIDFNPWNSRIEHADYPDYMILDLDPEGTDFNRVVEVARRIHLLFERAGIESYCKTSGATGLHVYIPLGGRYRYDQARQFAEIIARLIRREIPEVASTERDPRSRKGKVYIDYLQNSRGQTVASAYSVRPRPGAPVSTPLAWHEVRPGLDPRSFTIGSIFRRLERVGDLWKPTLGSGIDIVPALDQLWRWAARR